MNMPLPAHVVLGLPVLLHLVAERTPGAPVTIFLQACGVIDVSAVHRRQNVGCGASCRVPGRGTIVRCARVTDIIPGPATDSHLHPRYGNGFAQVVDIFRSMRAVAIRAIEGRIGRGSRQIFYLYSLQKQVQSCT